VLFESLNPVIPNNSQKCLEDLGLADFLRSHARFVPPAAYRGMSGTNLVTLHIYVTYIYISLCPPILLLQSNKNNGILARRAAALIQAQMHRRMAFKMFSEPREPAPCCLRRAE
jgi:hypothetical protein